MIWGPKKSIGLILPQELYQQVKTHAEKRDQSVSWYVRRALRFYLWHEIHKPEALLDSRSYWQ